MSYDKAAAAFVPHDSMFADEVLAYCLPGFRPGSRHNADIRVYVRQWLLLGGLFVVVIILMAVSMGAGAITKEVGTSLGLVVSVMGAAAGLVLSKIHGAAEMANKRIGIVDTFLSDILSICAVMYSLNLVRFYCDLHAHPGATSDRPWLPGEGDYLAVFHGKCAELAMLDREVVRRVTAFYRYFQASRDAAGELASWDGQSEEARRRTLEAVLLQLALCLTSAGKAVGDLADGEHMQGRELIDDMLRQCRAFFVWAGTDPELLANLGLSRE